MPRPPAKRGRGRGRQAQKGPSKPAAGRVAKPTREDVLRESANNINSNSDDSDGLVVTSSRSRSGSRKRKDVYMSGGLGKGDVKNAHKMTPTRKEAQSPLANRSRPGSAMTAAQNQKAKNQTTPTANNGPAESSRLNTGNRPRGYSATLSIAGKRPDVNSKLLGTPGFESSMLSNFKRRPRQPSILQMMQDGEDWSSDLNDDDFLGNFSPEDESTPLNRTRGKSLVANSESSPSQLPSSADSKKRKRSQIDVQVPRSPTAVVYDSPGGSPAASDDEQIEMSEDDSLPPQRSETPPTPEIFSQTMAPPMSSSPGSSTGQPVAETTSDSHATTKRDNVQKGSKKTKQPPTVSSATLQDHLLPKRRQRRQQPRRYDKATDFDIPDDVSLDEQDGQPNGAASDEDELSYLPTTRRPRKKALTESTNITNGKSKTKKGDHGSKKRNNGISTAKPASVAPQIATTASTAAKTSQESQPKDGITYSSRTRRAAAEGDKENQPFDTSSSLSSPVDSEGDTFNGNTGLPPMTKQTPASYLSEELEQQAKKFAEIDNWTMEFEDVSPSASQSSPYR